MTRNERPSKAARTRATRRMFGGIRQLPSGRYQVRYLDPSGNRQTAPRTFTTKREADAWLATSQADLVRGTWRDPDEGSQKLADYLHDWLATRVDLAPSTRHLYADLTRLALCADLTRPPSSRQSTKPINLGAFELRHITVAVVRDWYAAAVYSQALATAQHRARRLNRERHRWPTANARAWARANGWGVADSGRLSPAVLEAYRKAGSPVPPPIEPAVPDDPKPRTQTARAYQLLRACLNAAVNDGHLLANPCRLPGAADVKAAERVPATPAEVVAIADAMPTHLATAVHVAAYTGLRAGELFGLTRSHVDLAAGTVRVERALVDVRGQLSFGPPKTHSSVRTVHVPPHVLELLRDHLDAYTRPGSDALVFARLDGGAVPRAQRTRLFDKARRAADRPDLRWHDLRHTGATLAAQAGASIRELQHRFGHATFVAAMRYQHASAERDRKIALQLSVLAGVNGNVVKLRESNDLSGAVPSLNEGVSTRSVD